MSMDITQSPPKVRTRWIIAGALVVIAGAIGALVLLRIFQRAPSKSIPISSQPILQADTGKVGDLVVTEEAMQLAEIKIGTVQARHVAEKLTVSGNVEPGGDQTAKLVPRVAGRVTAVYAVAGQEVRAGQTLATIESPALAKAQADYQHAGLRFSAARTNLERQQKLARLGAFGQPRVQEARRMFVASQGEERTAESEVTGAKAQVSEAESDLLALRAALSQSQTQVKVTQSRFNRAELLLKEQLIARQEWEQSQADLERAQADVKAAQAKIGQGEAKVATAKAQLGIAQAKLDAAIKRQEIETQAVSREEEVFKGRYTSTKEIVDAEAAMRQAQIDQQASAQAVRLLGGTPGGGSTVPVVTPISGRVHERSVTVGETVDTEHPLFTVMNLGVVWAQLAIAPRDLPSVHVGQRVSLTSETAPGTPLTGTISSVGATINEATRMVRVRTAIANPSGALTPGAFVRGTIVTDIRRECAVVPEGAIQDHSGKKTVYVANTEPGAFEVRHVHLGIRGDGWREITSGVLPGDRIATNGTFYLKSEALKSALSDGCCAVPGGK